MLLPIAALLTGLQLPPLDLADPLMPAQLERARALELSQPDRCVFLTRAFLAPPEAQATQPPRLFKSSSPYQEPSEKYQNQQQILLAHLILGSCQARNREWATAGRTLDESLALSRQWNMPELEALTLYLQARLMGLQTQQPEAAQRATEQLDRLLKRQGHWRAKQALLGQLLLLKAAVALKQDDHIQVRHWLGELQQQLKQEASPTLHAWSFALYGELMQAEQQADLALGYYGDALKLAGEQQDPLLSAQMADRMSTLLEQRGSTNRAISLGEQAVEGYQKIGNPLWLAKALQRLAVLTRESGEVNMALALLFNAQDQQRNGTDPIAMATLSQEIGKTYLLLYDYPAAKAYLNAALQTFRQHGDQKGELVTLLTLSELSLEQYDPDHAIAMLEDLLQHQPHDHWPSNLYQLLSQAYEQKHRFGQALASYKRYTQLQHQELQQRQQAGNTPLREDYALLDKEQQIQTLVSHQQRLADEKSHARWFGGLAATFAAMLGLLLLRLWLRFDKQGKELQRWRRQVLQDPDTGLPSEIQLMRDLQPEPLPAEERHNGESYGTTSIPSQQFVLIRIPGLSALVEQRGRDDARELEQMLFARLRSLLPDRVALYQLPEGRLFCRFREEQMASVIQRLQNLFDTLRPLLGQYGLDTRMAAGLLSHPFLSRSPEAITQPQLLELGYLALAAALQLSRKTASSAWVELAALDCQQAAFFNGQIRASTLRAIDKGLVKINASCDKQLINWRQLDE